MRVMTQSATAAKSEWTNIGFHLEPWHGEENRDDVLKRTTTHATVTAKVKSFGSITFPCQCEAPRSSIPTRRHPDIQDANLLTTANCRPTIIARDAQTWWRDNPTLGHRHNRSGQALDRCRSPYDHAGSRERTSSLFEIIHAYLNQDKITSFGN